MGWPAGHPEKGDYSGVDEAAVVMTRLSRWLQESAQYVRRSSRMASEAWEGEAAEAFVTACQRAASIMSDNSEVAMDTATTMRSVSSAMEDYVFPTATKFQIMKEDAEEDLIRARERLAESVLMDPLVPPFAEERRVREAVEEIAFCVRKIDEIGVERDEEATLRAAQIKRTEFQMIDFTAGNDGDGRVPLTMGGLGAVGGGLMVAVPEWWTTTDLAGRTPDQIRSQWDSLTDAQCQALIESNPLVLGNLDGIPLGWRCKANEINIRNEIDRLQAEIDRINRPAPRGPFGDNADSTVRVAELQKQIDAYGEMLRPEKFDENDPTTWRTIDYGPDGKYAPYDPANGWPKGSQVILFDPENKRIGTYHGTFTPEGDIPSTYQNIVTFTPGTGTQPWKWDDPDTRGSQMFYDANKQGGSTAVIVYSDGPQPQLADAITPGYAQDMGPKLVAFADAYIPKDSTYTAIGHSYGATNVAQAEAAGLDADRVLYVSPAGYGQAPGTDGSTHGNMVTGLDDFPNTGDSPHYVMIARNDPIVGLIQGDEWYDFGIHGDSPTHDPDVTRLETGWLNIDKPQLGYLDEGVSGSHSSPFEYTSTAHQNMVEVIIGGEAEGYGGDGIFHEPEDWTHPRHRAGGPDRKDEDDWPDIDIE